MIADNSILAMLQNSLTDGSLYWFADIETQLDVTKSFWNAVKATFPAAWGSPANK